MGSDRIQSPLKFPVVLINGEPGNAVDVYDRAFQYGDGVFETIAVVDQKPCLLDEHLHRLDASLSLLKIQGVNIDDLREALHEVSSNLQSGVLKVLVSRGSGARGYQPPADSQPVVCVYCTEQSINRQISELQPVKVKWSDVPVSVNSCLAGVKHLNRLENILAANGLRQGDYDECLMLDDGGNVIEASSANLFLWKEEQLITPSLDRCGIKGIVRNEVLKLAKESGIMVEIATQVSRKDCLESDAVFLTNSVAGIRPLQSLETVNFDKNNWPENLYKNILSHVFS